MNNARKLPRDYVIYTVGRIRIDVLSGARDRVRRKKAVSKPQYIKQAMDTASLKLDDQTVKRRDAAAGGDFSDPHWTGEQRRALDMAFKEGKLTASAEEEDLPQSPRSPRSAPRRGSKDSARASSAIAAIEGSALPVSSAKTPPPRGRSASPGEATSTEIATKPVSVKERAAAAAATGVTSHAAKTTEKHVVEKAIKDPIPKKWQDPSELNFMKLKKWLIAAGAPKEEVQLAPNKPQLLRMVPRFYQGEMKVKPPGP